MSGSRILYRSLPKSDRKKVDSEAYEIFASRGIRNFSAGGVPALGLFLLSLWAADAAKLMSSAAPPGFRIGSLFAVVFIATLAPAVLFWAITQRIQSRIRTVALRRIVGHFCDQCGHIIDPATTLDVCPECAAPTPRSHPDSKTPPLSAPGAECLLDALEEEEHARVKAAEWQCPHHPGWFMNAVAIVAWVGAVSGISVFFLSVWDWISLTGLGLVDFAVSFPLVFWSNRHAVALRRAELRFALHREIGPFCERCGKRLDRENPPKSCPSCGGPPSTVESPW
ncbi:MAG: hypothetical protein VYC34_09320 [Planctomycetota bacterium]|nr:hypothetical protein [Planctomycetota bacterium]